MHNTYILFLGKWLLKTISQFYRFEIRGTMAICNFVQNICKNFNKNKFATIHHLQSKFFCVCILLNNPYIISKNERKKSLSACIKFVHSLFFQLTVKEVNGEKIEPLPYTRS